MNQEKAILDILYNCEYLSRSVLSLVFCSPYYTDSLITQGIKDKQIKVRKYNLEQQKDKSTCLSLTAPVEKQICIEKGHAEELAEREKNRNRYKYIERRRKMMDAVMMCCVAGAFGYPRKGSHYSDIYELGNSIPYNISPFTPPGRSWNKELMLDCVGYEGIVINRDQIRKYNEEVRGDYNHFKYSSASGVLLTNTGPYMLYSATNGYLYLRDIDEFYMLNEISMELHAKGVYSPSKYPTVDKAFVFLPDKPSFRAIIENRKNLSSKVFRNFTSMYLIPTTMDGVRQINRIIFMLVKKQEVIKSFMDEGCFLENSFDFVFPLKEKESGLKLFYGADMELISLREFYRIVKDPVNETQEYGMICYKWQVPYYQQVFGKDLKYWEISDD